MNTVALAGVFVNQVEDTKLSTPLGEVGDEVPAPDVVAVFRLLCKARGAPLTALSPPRSRHLQSFLASEILCTNFLFT